MTQRERFEAFARKPPREWDVSRHPDNDRESWPGQYKAYNTLCAWEAWQAACPDFERVLQEREMLARGIYEAAVQVGILREGANVGGPMLLMLCEDLAEAAAPKPEDV